MKLKFRAFLAFIIILILASALLSGCGTPKYTVTFNPSGGEITTGEIVQTVEEGQSATPPELTKGISTYVWDSEAWQNVTADVTVTAVWTDYFTVTFDFGNGETAEQVVAAGESAVPPEAEKEGYTLSWDSEAWRNVTADATVNAVWTRNPMSADELREYLAARTVTVISTDVQGTETSYPGVLIDSDGTVLTLYRAIHMTSALSVQFPDGTAQDVTLIRAFSVPHDLAELSTGRSCTEFMSLAADVPTSGEETYVSGADGMQKISVLADNVQIGLAPCLQLDAAVLEDCLGAPVVDEFGNLAGIIIDTQEESGKSYAAQVSALSALEDKTEMSLADYGEWIAAETAEGVSWSPMDYDFNCFYSLVHTYGKVTGEACLVSNDGYGDQEGYHDGCYYYQYAYNRARYDEYVAYLQSQGYALKDTREFADGRSEYYWSDLDGICIDLYTATSDGETVLYILPKYNYLE